MFRLLFLLTVILAVMCSGGNAGAWEVELNGNYSLEYFYVSRMGPGDLFGDANRAQAGFGTLQTTIGMAGPVNNQIVVEGASSKGADGSFTQSRYMLRPVLRINPAVEVRSEIGFQGDFNANAPLWASPPQYKGFWRSYGRSEETYQALAAPVLNYAYGVWKLPIGAFWFGRKPFAFGPGWSGLHRENTTTTGFGIDVPYGPFVFKAFQEFGQTGTYNTPYDVRNADLSTLTLVSSVDRNQQKRWGSLYSLEYLAGNMTLGVLSRTDLWNNVHTWPQGSLTLRDDRSGGVPALFLNSYLSVQGQNGGQATLYPIYGDVLLETVILYGKYFDGRFFANLEWDQQYIWARRLQGRPISGFPRGWFAEAGALVGPAKLSLAAVYRSGHDRAGGILDVVSSTGTNNQTAIQVANTWNLYLGGGDEALLPYTTLLAWYGGGNNSYDAVGKALFQDFKGYAGRVDYAMAANLNLWASYLYARRASNTGNWWGQFTGGIGTAPIRGTNVPNDNLGWEAQIGLNWQLLDSTLLYSKVSYWKPGAWFKHAYQDYSTLTAITDPSSDVHIWLNPDRGIDPIVGATIGFEIKL